MKEITVKGVHFATLENKQQWINRVPAILPLNEFERKRLLWVDANGNQMFQGSDFEAAEDLGSYPVTIYRMQSASEYKASMEQLDNCPIVLNELYEKTLDERSMQSIKETFDAIGRQKGTK